MFGNPPVPTLLLQFREQPPGNDTAHALSPNGLLNFPEQIRQYLDRLAAERPAARRKPRRMK